jgi:glyoxylate/hydroxypyruvate reductase A
MNLLLAGSFGPEERLAWTRALQQVLPTHRLVADEPALQALGREHIDVALVANPAPGSLQGLPRLRLIQSLWAGVDRLLADPTLPAGVPVARMVDPAMNAAMAETALWAVLSLHRGFFDYQGQQRQALWQQRPQRRADEVAVTVLGFGQMGRAVAQRLAAQGYRVAAWRREPAPADTGAAPPAVPAGVDLQAGLAALPALLARTEVLVNLLPLTASTRGLLDARCFAALPRGAAVVNLARGAHLVEADLLAALASGQLRHAVLDVFQTEPLPAEHAFWQHGHITVLPHAAALTDERSAAAVVADNLARLVCGEPLRHLVQAQRGY